MRSVFWLSLLAVVLSGPLVGCVDLPAAHRQHLRRYAKAQGRALEAARAARKRATAEGKKKKLSRLSDDYGALEKRNTRVIRMLRGPIRRGGWFGVTWPGAGLFRSQALRAEAEAKRFIERSRRLFGIAPPPKGGGRYAERAEKVFDKLQSSGKQRALRALEQLKIPPWERLRTRSASGKEPSGEGKEGGKQGDDG